MKVETYISENGKLLAKCQNSISDVNVWAVCYQKCENFKNCFGNIKDFSELIKGVEHGNRK